MTAQAGWTAAELARAGSVSLREGYEGANGLARAFAGRRLDAEVVQARIGQEWQTLRVAFKPFPVCAFNQTPVITALALRDKLDGRKIEAAVVRMNPYECGYAGMDSKGPFSTIGGTLMSIPFCIAQTLLRGAPSMAMMTDYHDPEINALIERVNLVADENVPTLCCRIELRLEGGAILTEACDMTPADYAWSFDDLRERLEMTAAQEDLPSECIAEVAAFSVDPVRTGIAVLNAAFDKARPLIKR